MEKTVTIEIDPVTVLDTLKRIWRPVYRATIVSHRLKRIRIESRAFFRQTVLEIELPYLKDFLRDQKLPLYAAALDERAEDVRAVNLQHAAVAVGSEGRGLSAALLEQCDRTLIIPMSPESESLNAAVAAAVLMWEAFR